MEGLFLVLLLFFIFVVLAFFGVKQLKPSAPKWNYAVVCFYFITFIVFILSMKFEHTKGYNEQLDLIDGDCYEFLGGKHIATYLVYFVLYHGVMMLLWRRQNKLAPIALSLSLAILMFGIILNILILVQLAGHDLSVIPANDISIMSDDNASVHIPFELMAFPFPLVSNRSEYSSRYIEIRTQGSKR